MPLSYTFGTQTTWQASWLDTDFAEVGACTTIPCTITGTNTLTITPLANTPAPAAYANYQRFAGIAVANNTGATSANVATIGLLPIYKDTTGGPVALVGGEIKIGNYIELIYDTALNTGTGGFHIAIAPSTANGTITGVTAGSGLAGGGVTGGVTLALATLADQRLLANVSGGAAAASATTASAFLDATVSSSRGSLLSRGAALWGALALGTAGQWLYSPGGGGDVQWRGGVTDNISAAGATQGTATQLSAAFNRVTSTGVGTGVILAATVAMPQWIWNDGANTLDVYPPVGAQINNLGTNVPSTIAAGSMNAYVMLSSVLAKTFT